MAIRRVEGEETNEQITEREEQEKAAEAKRQEREEAMEKRARDAELAAARAESALEEARRRPEVHDAPTGPSEEQWQRLEAENPGKTRFEIQAEANKMAAITDARLKPLSDRTQAAEERAAKAEERASRLEGRRALDKVEDAFYKKNGALEAHKADVEAFLAEFPDTTDAKTYEKRLNLASDYVRGKVKTLRSEPRRGEFSSRQNEHDDQEDDARNDDFDGRFDPKGTGGNRGAIALMEGVVSNFGKDTKHEDSVDVWKKSRDEEDRGVQIDSSEEVKHARRVLSRGGNLGGKRGEV